MTTNNTMMIRPGILLGLKTTVTGGVRYSRKDLDADRENATRWETTKIVDDQDEHDRASDVRIKAVREIRRVAAVSSFGLLVANKFEPELDAAIVRARDLIEAHNSTARCTVVRFFCLKGRIAETDEAAAKAIASDVSDLLAEMERGITKLDPAAIRDAANRARQVLSILSDEKQVLANAAIEAARKAARQIVARIEKKGEDAATVLVSLDSGPVAAARMAFLDFGDGAATAAPADALPAVNVERFADVGDEVF